MEHRFLSRLLVGELRQGALEGMMLDAVAKAADVPASAVRRALMLEPDLGAVAGAALREGEAGLARFGLALFQPLKPMLASPAADVGSALGQLGEAALEYKLDGVRIQVHKRGDDVRVFTRRLHDVTPAVPDVVGAVRGFPAHELILDGEVLTFRSDGRPQPFQTTMRRFGRRLDVARLSETLPLRPFFFDCLHVDGESLIDRRCDERVGALESAIPAGHRIRRIVTAEPEEAEVFLRSALQAGHEGVMAKSLTATYEAGARGAAWLKLKPVHTLDLVVLAAEWGHGRRKGWLSNLHLGARDPATGDFAMLGKTFKGMTDETLTWQTRQLLELETARDAHTVYVRPELVVEVAFNEVQTSPRYPAGMALRFARLKTYRFDKRAQDADTLDSVRAIHEGRTRLGVRASHEGRTRLV